MNGSIRSLALAVNRDGATARDTIRINVKGGEAGPIHPPTTSNNPEQDMMAVVRKFPHTPNGLRAAFPEIEKLFPGVRMVPGRRDHRPAPPAAARSATRRTSGTW